MRKRMNKILTYLMTIVMTLGVCIPMAPKSVEAATVKNYGSSASIPFEELGTINATIKNTTTYYNGIPGTATHTSMPDNGPNKDCTPEGSGKIAGSPIITITHSGQELYSGRYDKLPTTELNVYMSTYYPEIQSGVIQIEFSDKKYYGNGTWSCTVRHGLCEAHGSFNGECKAYTTYKCNAFSITTYGPEIVENIQNCSVYEGNDATFRFKAKLLTTTSAFQWQKQNPTSGIWSNIGNSENYVVANTKVSGTTWQSVLTVKNVPYDKSQKTSKYRCIAGAEGSPRVTSAEGVLTVAKKDFQTIDVVAMSSSIGDVVGDNIYIVFRYNNNDIGIFNCSSIEELNSMGIYMMSEICEGDDKKTLEQIKTEYNTVASLVEAREPVSERIKIRPGINTYYMYATPLDEDKVNTIGEYKFASMTINGIDTTPPVISSFTADKIFTTGTDFVEVSSISDGDDVMLKVTAQDAPPASPDSVLYYKWFKNGEEVQDSTSNTLRVIMDKEAHTADGVYTCEVRDRLINGNTVSTEEIVLEHNQIIIDTIAPELSYNYAVYGSSPFAKITASAEDNHESDRIRYLFKEEVPEIADASSDSIILWLNESIWNYNNELTTAENKTYYIGAKDIAGNIAYTTKEVTCIPNVAPTIESLTLEEEDTKLRVLATSYDKEDPTLTYTLDGIEYATNVMPINSADRTAVHTLIVKDVKNSTAKTSFTLDDLKIYITDDAGKKLAAISKSPLTWTNNTGVTLKVEVIADDVVSNKAIAFVDITDEEKAVKTSDFLQKTGSSSYSYVANYKKGQDTSKPLKYRVCAKKTNGTIYYSDVTIKNIDAIVPTYTTPVFDNDRITFTAGDTLSGLYAIYYKLNTNGVIKTASIYQNGTTETQEIEIPVSQTGIYDIVITDNVGNKREGEPALKVEVPYVRADNPNLDYPNKKTKDVVITQTPTDWTNTNVKCEVAMSKVGIKEYSWDNGVTWGQSLSKVTDENRTFNFKVKDNYGNIFEGPSHTVSNIDKTAPTISETGSGTSYSATCSDSGSGVRTVIVNGASYSEAKKTSYPEGTSSVTVSISATENGTYTVAIEDYAGNKYEKSMFINNVTTNTDKKATVKTIYKETPIDRVVTKEKVVFRDPEEPEEVIVPQVVQTEAPVATSVKTDRDTVSGGNNDDYLEEIITTTRTRFSNGDKVSGDINMPTTLFDNEIPLVDRLIELAASPVGFIIILALLLIVAALIVLYYRDKKKLNRYRRTNR